MNYQLEQLLPFLYIVSWYISSTTVEHCHCESIGREGRRRRRGEGMSGKGKRRSARLLKLEEQKNDDTTATACLLDPWQIIRNSISSARGKRKRNEEIQRFPGEASSSRALCATTDINNLSSKSSAVQIIEYILDTLEMRDTHELFAMPDDIQVSDYSERVNRPGDFATLRQKNKDGMYSTLEQFENDVYMVFQKAMSINSQDTIPYREAMSLLHQAKQVFLSLKSNQMYSESELAAWRQKHLVARSPAKANGKDDDGGSSGGGGGGGAPPTAQQRPSAPARKRVAAKTGGAADKSTARQRGGARESNGTPGRRARKAAAPPPATKAAELGGAGAEERRLAYAADETDHRRRMAPVVPRGQHATLVYQPQTAAHTYQDSLRRFVRHAGMKARVAAEFRSLECDVRTRQIPGAPAYWPYGGFASSSGAGTASRFLPRGYCPPQSPPSAAFNAAAVWRGRAADASDQAPPRCTLETDEVLKLLVLIGRPAFMERARRVLGHKRGVGHEKPVTIAGDEGGKAGVPAAKPGKKGSASEPAAIEFGPFAPPKLIIPGRQLGFSQFAGSSVQPFKVTPTTPDVPDKKNKK
uniref:Bromo domain-containing protein n=1 Tax=Oryza brachyantha TaxID=4533 RepID=J3LNG7_ORYBR